MAIQAYNEDYKHYIHTHRSIRLKVLSGATRGRLKLCVKQRQEIKL